MADRAKTRYKRQKVRDFTFSRRTGQRRLTDKAEHNAKEDQLSLGWYSGPSGSDGHVPPLSEDFCLYVILLMYIFGFLVNSYCSFFSPTFLVYS